MTDTDIIIEVAKLDGYDNAQYSMGEWIGCKEKWRETIFPSGETCLTSRDAIIPVIEKIFNPIKQITHIRFSDILMDELEGYSATTYGDFEVKQMMTATPKQLCIALLKATGKWKD